MPNDNDAWMHLRVVRQLARDAIERGDTSPALTALEERITELLRRAPDVRGAFEELEAAIASGKPLKRPLNRARVAAGLPIRREYKGRRSQIRLASDTIPRCSNDI